MDFRLGMCPISRSQKLGNKSENFSKENLFLKNWGFLGKLFGMYCSLSGRLVSRSMLFLYAVIGDLVDVSDMF